MIHLRQIDRQATLHRQDMTLQRGTGAVGDNREAILVAQRYSGRHIVDVLGEYHRIGQHGVVGRFIASMVLTHGLRRGHAIGEARL